MECPYCGEEVSQDDLDYDGTCPNCHANLADPTGPDEPDEPDEWVEVGEAAKEVKISRDTLMDYIENGDLEHRKVKVVHGWEERERHEVSRNSLYELLGKRGEILGAKLKGKSRKGGRVRKTTGPLSEPE